MSLYNINNNFFGIYKVKFGLYDVGCLYFFVLREY